MQLRPPEFEIDDDQKPFDNDRLNRRSRIEALTRVIVAEDGPAVISVNGGFGTGKSAFMRMLAANLRLQDGVEVQEFNAWQQSYTDDPLVDVVSALGKGRAGGSGLARVAAKYGRALLKGAASTAVGVVSAGIVDLDRFAGVDQPQPGGQYGAWADAERNIAEFQEALQAVVENSSGKIVVLVDELDRCRPDYAIDLLNAVRHLLAVPRVVAVLGVNLDELGHRVKEVFGPGTEAGVYLRRFVDLPIDLPMLDETTLNAFSHQTLVSAGLSGHGHSGSLKTVLELMSTETDASLRDFQQTARRVAAVIDMPSVPDGAKQDPTTLEMAIAALMLLRHLDRPTYEAFVAGRSNALAAIAALRRELAEARNSGTRQVRATLERVEAQLLRMSSQTGYSMIETSGFEQLYLKAGLGDGQQLQEVRRLASNIPEYFVQPLSDLIELVS